MTTSNSNFKSAVSLSVIGSDHLPLFYFPLLAQFDDVLHFITTRQGGCSEPPFSSFNLASHVGDKEEHVLKNRDELARALGISVKNFFFNHQEHGTNIFLIDHNHKAGLNNSQDLTDITSTSDALLTTHKNICLLVFVADCVPVLLFDYRQKVIGLVHAGWKGTVGLISQKTVQLMKSHYGSQSQDIICAIGPSIGPCCYQVGKDVLAKVRKSFPEEGRHLIRYTSNLDQFFFDLWQANKIQLLKAGIPEENIALAQLCTSCHPDQFFSNRKEQQRTGRFAAGIMLK